MDTFVSIEPNTISLPELRPKPKKVNKVYLEIGHVLNLVKQQRSFGY